MKRTYFHPSMNTMDIGYELIVASSSTTNPSPRVDLNDKIGPEEAGVKDDIFNVSPFE